MGETFAPAIVTVFVDVRKTMGYQNNTATSTKRAAGRHRRSAEYS